MKLRIGQTVWHLETGEAWQYCGRASEHAARLWHIDRGFSSAAWRLISRGRVPSREQRERTKREEPVKRRRRLARVRA
jgi:hypothetical protein